MGGSANWAPERTQLVDALAADGITATVGPTGDGARAPMTVAQTEALFGSPWGLYQPAEGDPVPIPDTPPSLPPELVEVVDLVTGLVPDPPDELSTTRRAAAPSYDGGTPTRTGTPRACDEAVTASGLADGTTGRAFGLFPNQLADAYGLSELRARGIDGRGVRAAIVGAGAPSPDDLAVFARCLGPARIGPSRDLVAPRLAPRRGPVLLGRLA